MIEVTAHIGKDTYQIVLSNLRHTLIADESSAHNGTDLGPGPEELLLMSLASCTAITLRMYANRKQFNIDAFDVKMSGDRTDETFIFTRDITITGSITEDERSRLMKVADACPVHKILTHPIKINTTLI